MDTNLNQWIEITDNGKGSSSHTPSLPWCANIGSGFLVDRLFSARIDFQGSGSDDPAVRRQTRSTRYRDSCRSIPAYGDDWLPSSGPSAHMRSAPVGRGGARHRGFGVSGCTITQPSHSSCPLTKLHSPPTRPVGSTCAVARCVIDSVAHPTPRFCRYSR